MVSVLVLLALGYGYYALLISPLESRLDVLDRSIDAEDMRIRSMRQIEAGLSGRRRELDELQRVLNEIWSFVGTKRDTAWLLRSIERYAVSTGVRFVGLTPGEEAEGKYVGEMPFEMSLDGSFTNLVAFCRLMEESEPAIALDSIRVVATDGGLREADAVLSVVVSGKTFYRTDESV